MKFLYGASVKKIQSYIFDSSRLKEIAGASELVEHVCNDLFMKFINENGIKDVDIVIQDEENIRALIRNREDAEKIMRDFPKRATEEAPGIQFIQSIVPLEGEHLTACESQNLEKELQKQIPVSSPYKDWSVVIKASRTGKPVAKFAKDAKDYDMDIATCAKMNAVNKHWNSLKKKFNVDEFSSDTGDIANEDNFVAVIHADGNSLGQKLMSLKDSPDYEEKWRDFSIELNSATVEAAARAYREIFQSSKKFRPIILGGDDLTVVCTASLAIPFTEKYLEYFKAETAKCPNLGKLTACAGIAFVKKNYPFYYGAELAEMLCGYAKKKAKECSKDPVPSSLMFAKELGGFVDSSFSDMEKRSLSIATDKMKVSFVFGPYKTSGNEEGGEKLPYLGDLIDAAKCMSEYSPLHSGIRNFITELHVSEDAAKFLAGRIEQIASEKGKDALMQKFKAALKRMTGIESTLLYNVLKKNTEGTSRVPAIDLLTVQQFTNKEEEKEND